MLRNLDSYNRTALYSCQRFYIFQLFGLSSRVETTSPSRNSRRFTVTRSPTEERVEFEDEFPYDVFGATLETLDLSDNSLAVVPISVCHLTSLEDLNLSG
jgi:Leucine-rich repeat (LRR) protein